MSVGTSGPFHLMSYYFMGTWISVLKPSRGTHLHCSVGFHQMGWNILSQALHRATGWDFWNCYREWQWEAMGKAGKFVLGPGAGPAQSVPVMLSGFVLTHLSLYTCMKSRLLQTGTVCVETLGFHFEYSTMCSEIWTSLLLWETLWHVELSCNTWETLKAMEIRCKDMIDMVSFPSQFCVKSIHKGCGKPKFCLFFSFWWVGFSDLP